MADTHLKGNAVFHCPSRFFTTEASFSKNTTGEKFPPSRELPTGRKKSFFSVCEIDGELRRSVLLK